MRAGTLRHRIAIQTPAAAANRDDYGDEPETWTTAATRWGELRYLSGRALERAQQIHSETQAQITTRYYPDAAPTLRLIHDSKTYDVLAAYHHDGRHIATIWLVKEHV